MRRERWTQVRWATGVVVLVVALSALWPSIHAISGLQEMVQAYPDPLKRAFGLDEIATGSGYLDVELFSIVLPGLFAAFGVSVGARLVAGDEESGALLPELVVPRPRRELLAAYAGTCVASSCLLGVVLFAAVAACSAVLSMGVPPARMIAASAGMAVIGAAHGLVALAAGAASGRRAVAIGVGGVVAAAGYLLHVAGTLVTSTASWGAWSPMDLVLDHPGLTAGWAADWWWAGVLPTAVLVLGALRFERRDVRLG